MVTRTRRVVHPFHGETISIYNIVREVGLNSIRKAILRPLSEPSNGSEPNIVQNVCLICTMMIRMK